MILDIIIPGAPHAQGRARFARIGDHVRTYDPKESKDWKSYAKVLLWEAVAKQGGGIFIQDGAVCLRVLACFACTSTDAKKKSIRECGNRWHTKKPDLDNIIKAIKDAGRSILWTDDSQVSAIHAEKIVLRPGESPFVQISVCKMGGGSDGQVATL